MEQKIFSKLNLYDQIGYLLVGSIGILMIVFDATIFSRQLPNFDAATLIIWFIIAYFYGHIIQGFSNVISEIPFLKFLIPEDKNSFNEKEKEILKEAEKYFRLKKQGLSRLWNLCYMFSTAKDITGQVQAFNSYYSLYRGWFIVFLLQSLFFIYLLFIGSFNLIFLIYFLLSTLLALVFYRRSKRFWKYTRNKVLETFVVVKTLNL